MATPQLGMKRLIYAPKVYAFVHSTTQNKIYNLSPDIVSGQVIRNINAESTASLVLRNRYKKWLRDPENNKSIFLPMDMVTIWLQRIAGKPIQVFTGYLDTVPYYQMYPGNCQLKATCTLKRLSNTYFDPGTMFFNNWITHIKGWQIDPTTGEATNPLQGFNAQNPNDKNQHTNDGGFAQLINDFMVQIANWRPEWVMVDGLDPNIPKIAAALYQKVNKEDIQALKGLQQIMQQVIGVHIVPAAGQATPDGPATVPNRTVSVVNSMKKHASSHNIPLVALVTAGQIASGMNPSYRQGFTTSSSQDDWGYGVYGLKPKVTNAGGQRAPGAGAGTTIVVHTGTEGDTIDGKTKKQIMSVDISSEIMVNKLLRADYAGATPQQIQHHIGKYSSLVKQNNSNALREWLQIAMNRSISSSDFQTALGKAQKYIGAWGTDHPGSATKEPLMTRTIKTLTHLTWDSDQVKTFRTQSDDQKVYKDTYAGRVDDSLAPYYWMARNSTKTLRLMKPTTSRDKNTLYLTGSTEELDQMFGTLADHTKVSGGKRALQQVVVFTGGQVRIASNGSTSTRNLGRGPAGIRPHIEISTPSNPTELAYPTFDGQKVKTKTVPIGFDPTKTGTGTTGASSNGQPTVRAEDVVAMSMASAFATQLEFPTDYISAMLLTGYKAFENDITCMDAIGQFCQASLRNYMSLPDGRFIAFYPDYFGAHGRQAYWPIYDIEITNGGVQLTDDQLSTHVYVTGDVGATDGSIDFMDRVASRGAITLDMPLALRSFIQPGILEQDENVHDMGWAPGNLRTAFDFYNHFGVRVYKQDVPIIRNTFFEFLYAWQTFMLKWAETFQTTFEFTFQPEIMAGGIVAFPQHNLQMFVKSVTHDFSYDSGFQTEAELMAPAAMNKAVPGKKLSEQDVGDLPGFAISGNVNAVGGVSD